MSHDHNAHLTAAAVAQLRNAVQQFDAVHVYGMPQGYGWGYQQMGLPYSHVMQAQQQQMVNALQGMMMGQGMQYHQHHHHHHHHHQGGKDVGRSQPPLPPLVPADGSDSTSNPSSSRPALDQFRAHGFDPVQTSEDELVGNVVSLAMDQDGSRLVQKKLREGCVTVIYNEVIDVADTLMTHMYGNYVVQMLFEKGTDEMRRQLYEKTRGKVRGLALNTFGCRILQQGLKGIPDEYGDMVVSELEGHVMECIQDQNGNHVIQRCIEHIPSKCAFIYNSFPADPTLLATHAYGCRVLQRVLESAVLNALPDTPIPKLIVTLLSKFIVLSCSPYGNYVAQHLVLYGPPHAKGEILKATASRLPELSKQKYASNVVEQMWKVYEDQRDRFLEEYLSGKPPVLIEMIKDKYGNYVVQQLLDASNLSQLQRVINSIDPYAPQLTSMPSGKHILAKVEKKRAVLTGQKMR
eukprot:TRINITY_DN2448_c0_g1_i1.p1 TRINITY_DN2448_c0_g1~~TRINITY_DN2448_c0_g1_i1.p1  ORF type:complete len:463 (+),score=87.14 TRINITY_DN2448_c0_g1_i1:499-1887(+)